MTKPSTNGIIPMEESKQSLTGLQTRWLRERLSQDSEAATNAVVGISKDTLRSWKKSPHFSDFLNTVINQPSIALRLLALQLTGKALDAVEWLLDSPKGSDKKAGLEAFHSITRSRDDTTEDDADRKLRFIIETLNYREGDKVLYGGSLPMGPPGLVEGPELPPTPDPGGGAGDSPEVLEGTFSPLP